MNNTTGGSNTAIGWEALTANTTGNNNTAIGNLALQSSVNHERSRCRRQTWPGLVSPPPIIISSSAITLVCTVFLARKVTGALSTTSTVRRFPPRRPLMVMVDSDGRLGTVTVRWARPGWIFAQRHPAPSHSRRRQASHARSESSELAGNGHAATATNRDAHRPAERERCANPESERPARNE